MTRAAAFPNGPVWWLTRCAAVLSLLLTTTGRAAVPPDDPAGFEGVPERIEGRIIDITTLRAERTFFSARQSASIATHVIHQAKETPWHHAYVRPHQRRVEPAPRVDQVANAVAEAEPNSAGRLRYRVRIGGSGATTYGSLAARGASANDGYTQGRGTHTATGLTADGGWRGRGARGHVGAAWSTTSLNWRRADETLDARDRTVVGLRAAASFGPPRREERVRVSIEASDYGLGPPGGPAGTEDAIAEARGALDVELSASAKPLTFALRGMGRRAEGTGDATSADTYLAHASLADRFAPILGGVASWRAGVALYSEPDVADGSGRSSVAAPFRLAWATGVGRVGLQVHGGYDVEQPALELYADRDHVSVNPDLPARTSKAAGVSLWTRVGAAILSGQVDAQDVRGLPIWVEGETDLGGARVISWTPVGVDAELLSWRARLTAPYGPRSTLLVEVSGESSSPGDDTIGQLPYRPTLSARAEASVELPGSAVLRLSVDRVGERYRTTTDPDRLEAYTRFSARATKTLTAAVDVFVTGQATAGTYRAFESQRGSELHALSQGGVGVGITGRI